MERVVSVGCGVVGVVLWNGVLAPNFYAILSQFRLQNAPRSGHDRAAIGPWSWSWSLFARPPIEWKEFHAEGGPITARSRRDRGSIRPRSWSSSTGLPCRPMKIPRSRSLHVRRHFANNCSRLMHLKPFDSMPIGRSSGCHVVRGKSFDPHHLLSFFFARGGFDDRVDSGPRDRSRPWGDRTLAARPRHLQGKTVWEHSPTRRK